MAGPRCRSTALAFWLWSLCLLCWQVAADHFLGKFEFPSQDSGSNLTFNNVDSVDVSWFTTSDFASPILVLYSDDSVPQPLVNMSVPTDGSKLVSMNFSGQAVTNATFSLIDTNSSSNSISSGSFNVVVNESVPATTWSAGSSPSGTANSSDFGGGDGGSDDHHHHHFDGGSEDDAMQPSTAPAPSGGLSPTIIALIVFLCVTFVFVILLTLRFIRVRRKLAAQEVDRKDTKDLDALESSSFTGTRPRSGSSSCAPPRPPPPTLSKQQRILGVNVGENPRRMLSRRYFGHALRSSNAENLASKYGIGGAMPASMLNEPSLALRPPGMPRAMSPCTNSRTAVSTPTEVDGITLPPEMPTSTTQSTFRGYELPAKQANISRSTLATESPTWSALGEKEFPMPPNTGGGVSVPVEKGEHTPKAWDGPLPSPPNIPELGTGGLSPSRGLRATAMSAVRGSGMTVPFALASPRNWKKSTKLSPDEGLPF